MGDKERGIWEANFFSPNPIHQRFLSGTTHGNSKNIEKGYPEILTKKPFHSHMKSFAFCVVPKKLVCIAAELTQAFLVLPYWPFCKKKEIEKNCRALYKKYAVWLELKIRFSLALHYFNCRSVPYGKWFFFSLLLGFLNWAFFYLHITARVWSKKFTCIIRQCRTLVFLSYISL